MSLDHCEMGGSTLTRTSPGGEESRGHFAIHLHTRLTYPNLCVLNHFGDWAHLSDSSIRQKAPQAKLFSSETPENGDFNTKFRLRRSVKPTRILENLIFSCLMLEVRSAGGGASTSQRKPKLNTCALIPKTRTYFLETTLISLYC